MSVTTKIKRILGEAWTVKISIGEDCDYIFETYFNNQPTKTKFRTGKVGTFSQCVDSFYSEWLKYRNEYWNPKPKGVE